MTSHAVHQEEALKQVLDVVEAHNPQAATRMKNVTSTGTPPNVQKHGDLVVLSYLCEAVAGLAGVVDQLANQPAQATTSKKRSTKGTKQSSTKAKKDADKGGK